MVKVIRGGSVFFQDDVKIIDSELDSSLNLPLPLPIFLKDELQILYKGHIFTAGKNAPNESYLKCYTLTFNLQAIDTPKAQEDKYFLENAALLDKIKNNFIGRVVNCISDISDTSKRMPQLGSELTRIINEKYPSKAKTDKNSGKGLISMLNDGSVFNEEMLECGRILIIDKKVYDLLTLPEYISNFENSFEKTFYKKVHEFSKSAAPEDISKMISENKEKINRKVLPKVRNNIWHSERSAKLYLDGTYWIPQFRGTYDALISAYQKILEKKVKVDAAR